MARLRVELHPVRDTDVAHVSAWPGGTDPGPMTTMMPTRARWFAPLGRRLPDHVRLCLA
jgi:hypothetical protein